MRSVSEGDPAALGALYDRYAGMVYSVALRVLRDAAAAEEILQDSFYQLWRTAAQFNPARGSLAGWLLVTARNRAISRLRRRDIAPPGSLGEDPLDDGTAIAPPISMEAALDQQQMLGRVRAAMGALPSPQRAALELAYFEGLTHSEIAARLSEPLGTIKSRLRAALNALRQALSP